MNQQETMVNFANDLLRNDSNGFITKKILKTDGTVSLVINISPSFFHLMYINSLRKETYDYLYDSCNDTNSNYDIFMIKGNLKKTLHLIELPISESLLNNVKVNLNVFNKRCCCEKCLSACYMFNVTEGIDLLSEFTRIFSSEHCKQWPNHWFQALTQQIFIFLSCIKNGKINKKLLESASLLARIFIKSKNNITSLIEIKYSYINFQIDLMNMVRLNENQNKHPIVAIPYFKGTGKEKLEIIDGIKMISFKTESDMNEYTNLEVKNTTRYLTKTNDLTKIKGWNRKLFLINNNNSDIENSEKINNQRITSKKTIKYKVKSAENFARYKSDGDELKFKNVMVGYHNGYNKHSLQTSDPVSDRNVFESDILEEFLMNESQLNISYEIPRLCAAEVFTNSSNKISKSLPIMTDGRNNNFEVDRETRSAFKKKSVGCQTDDVDIETKYEDTVKRSRLLPTILDTEDDCKRKKIEHPASTIHECGLNSVGTIAKGTCLPNETVQNLHLLSNGNEALSDLSKENRHEKIIIGNEELNSFRDFEEINEFDKISLTGLNSSDIYCGVLSVVKDLVDYVERNSEISHEIPYDPMEIQPIVESPKNEKKTKVPKIIRELRKLINVSVVDESEPKAANVCDNDFCRKGCICYSLNTKVNVPTHCGNYKCMFKCSCPYQFRFNRNTINGEQNIILAKEELSWHNHQTVVIRSETGDAIEFINKSQRVQKLPKRFRNDVLIGAEFDYCFRTANIVTPLDRSVIPKWTNINKNESLNKNMNERRLEFCSGILIGNRTLADVFIWCTIHDKYNCLCGSSIARLNDNTLIWKSTKSTRYLSHKVMHETKLLSNNNSLQVYLYDYKKFSARTYGIPFEYAVRNRSEIFLKKRKCELEHGILNCTNSFIKIKFFMITNKEMISDNDFETELDIKEVYKSSVNEYIYMKNVTDEEDMEIEVTDEVMPNMDNRTEPVDEGMNPIAVDHVIIIVDSDEETVMPNMQHSKMQKQNDSAVQSKDSVDYRNGIDLPNAPHTAAEQPAVNLLKMNLPKFNIIQSGKKSIKMKNNSLKKPLVPSPYKYHRLEEVDLQLENELIKLDEHPECNQFYGADNLPKLALMCLTPGIGYLPILKFNQNMLLVQDPIISHIYRSYKDLDAANLWLNRFFKNRLLFESNDINLKWIIVKPGLLKLKNCLPFDITLLDKSSIMINKNGALTFRGNRENSLRREQILMKSGQTMQRQVTLDYHLNIKRTNDTGDNFNIKRRKLLLEASEPDGTGSVSATSTLLNPASEQSICSTTSNNLSPPALALNN